MKIRELIKDDVQSPGWWVYNYIINSINYDYDEVEQVLSANPVLRNVYIAESFLDEFNNMGLEGYLDSQAIRYRKYLVEVFGLFGNEEMVALLKELNDIVEEIESQLDSELNGNIEEINADVSREIEQLDDKLHNLNINDVLYDNISRYVVANLNIDI